MNGMTGYWISPTGKIQEVYEHFKVVADSPKKYGITEEDIEELDFDREKILIKVIQNNWIRVRGHKNYTTFEFWEYDIGVLTQVLKFVKRTKMWDNEIIYLNELKSRRGVELTVEELKDPEKMEKYHIHNPKKRKKRVWEKTAHEDILHIWKRKGFI